MNNLQNEANKLRMTPAERATMKALIFGVPSPATVAPAQSPYFIFSYQFLHTRVLAGALAVVLVFGGAGTTAAAQGALPGDWLYPVKVSVNEAVEVALATTPKARAEVSAKLAERRVEEAEALAARGELNAEVGSKLAADFEEHADTAHKSAEAVAVEDPAAAETLRTKLSSSLAAHGAILATLTVGGGSENQQGAEMVAAKVIARADTGATANMRSAKVAPQAMTMSLMVAEDATSTGTTTDEASTTVSLEGDMIESTSTSAGVAADYEKAQALAERTQLALESTRERFEDLKGEYMDVVVAKVSGELVEIENVMEEASTTLADGDAAFAAELYTEALQRATKLEVLLKVEAKLKRNIITPILEQRLIVDPASFPLL